MSTESVVLSNHLKFMSTESVVLSNHLILCHPLLLLPSIFPSIRVFAMGQLFTLDGQSIFFSITWYGSCRLPPYNLHSQYHAYNAENSEVRLCAKSLQRCLTLCNPMDCSPPDPSAHGILQVRILQWVAMPSSRGSSEPGDLTHISYVSCIGWRVF